MKKKKIITISVLTVALLTCLVIALVLLIGSGEHRHRFGHWLTVTSASCTDYGVEKRICADCDYEETRSFSRLGHKFGENNVCTVCSYILEPTEGLRYILSTDRSFYWVDMGMAEATDVVVPRYYQGPADEKPLPVNGVYEDGFAPRDGRLNVTSVYLPDGLLTVGARAFRGCEELLSCRMSITATEIGNFAFENCTALKEIEIVPKASIGTSAFGGCTALRAVEIPDSVSKIGSSAFAGCTALTDVTFSHLEDVETGKAVATVSNGMFENCTALREIHLYMGTKTIENNAFKGCTGLRRLYLPEGIAEIKGTAILDTVMDIYYEGTMRKWKSIAKSVDWIYSVPGEDGETKVNTVFISCKNGTLTQFGNQVGDRN